MKIVLMNCLIILLYYK